MKSEIEYKSVKNVLFIATVLNNNVQGKRRKEVYGTHV